MLPAALTNRYHAHLCHSCHGNSLRAGTREGRPRALGPLPPRRGPPGAAEPGAATGVAAPRPALPTRTRGWHRGTATEPPGRLCPGLRAKRNLGAVRFPSWPNVMHKGRSVPAAADALSPPEPPAHERPYLEAGIFHSIPRHSDMLQCPGTLAVVPVSAADTHQTRRIARPTPGHQAEPRGNNRSRKSHPERRGRPGARGIPALHGVLLLGTTLLRDAGCWIREGTPDRGELSPPPSLAEQKDPGSSTHCQQHPQLLPAPSVSSPVPPRPLTLQLLWDREGPKPNAVTLPRNHGAQTLRSLLASSSRALQPPYCSLLYASVPRAAVQGHVPKAPHAAVVRGMHYTPLAQGEDALPSRHPRCSYTEVKREGHGPQHPTKHTT